MGGSFMMGRTHAMSGAVAAVAVLPALDSFGVEVNGWSLVVATVSAAGGAMLPDLDHPNAPAPAAADPAAILTGGDATAAAAPGALVPLPPCPKCGAPTAIRRSFRGGFCGCTKYPECKGTAPVPAGALPKREPPKPAGVNCPDCSKPMIIRQGRRGPFAGCSGYPKCRGTMPMEAVSAAAGGGGGAGGGGDPAPA